MIKYINKTYYTDIDFNFENTIKNLEIDYIFSKAELDYLNGTGTFDGVDILKVFYNGDDITQILHPDYINELEQLVLDKHQQTC